MHMDFDFNNNNNMNEFFEMFELALMTGLTNPKDFLVQLEKAEEETMKTIKTSLEEIKHALTVWTNDNKKEKVELAQKIMMVFLNKKKEQVALMDKLDITLLNILLVELNAYILLTLDRCKEKTDKMKSIIKQYFELV